MNTLGTHIKLKPSKQLITLFILLVIGSVGIILTLPIFIALKIGWIVLCVSYGGYILYRHGFLISKNSLRELVFHSDSCMLRNDKHSFTAELCGDSTVTTWLCILRFKIPGKRLKQSCVIVKDAVEGDHYRQLIIALRNMKLHGNSR